ncbi:response regulator [Roseateles sp. DB2]|uniref:response regulator n=1 Tax=Roseateles sp. DB2 TaxID=3453717 RepID=UPI003EECD10B
MTAPMMPASGPSPEAAATELPRLLYVEDNPINMLIVEELVNKRGGIALFGAETVAQGLAQAGRLLPRLILVDMQLPDGDGHGLLQALRADPSTAGIPCVALSANAMPEDVRRAGEAGFADYWTKPIDFRVFLAGLDRFYGPR